MALSVFSTGGKKWLNDLAKYQAISSPVKDGYISIIKRMVSNTDATSGYSVSASSSENSNTIYTAFDKIRTDGSKVWKPAYTNSVAKNVWLQLNGVPDYLYPDMAILTYTNADGNGVTARASQVKLQGLVGGSWTDISDIAAVNRTTSGVAEAVMTISKAYANSKITSYRLQFVGDITLHVGGKRSFCLYELDMYKKL